MRLNRRQALWWRSDLLLLEAPTHHLDLDDVRWLEDWLEHYPGTLLLVTHDRDFLDAAVTEIVHLDQRQLRHYTGNYAQFERERALAAGGGTASANARVVCVLGWPQTRMTPSAPAYRVRRNASTSIAQSIFVRRSRTVT